VAPDPHSTAFDPTPLREAATRRLYRRSVVTGQVTLPAVPALLDEYVAMCAKLFAGVGRAFTDSELDHVREVLADQLAQAYTASPRSTIVISYEAPVGTVLNYLVKAEWWTVEGAYENWIGTREPPLFGAEPDALVWTLSSEATDPTTHPVLDIGAGTGRNALALARRGHPVDAVESTPKFAEMIRADADREALNVRVIESDVFAELAELRRDYQLIVTSEVVSDFRTPQQLRAIFELATGCLAPGGRLVFNAFLARPPYVPDEAALELGQQCYTSIFTRAELRAAASGLPLRWISDDSVFDYERAHLPDGAWPPTSWYADWVSGLDVFDVPREQSPIELRWLVYEKLID
jgi:SAM-dependent methyltransferase